MSTTEIARTIARRVRNEESQAAAREAIESIVSAASFNYGEAAACTLRVANHVHKAIAAAMCLRWLEHGR